MIFNEDKECSSRSLFYEAYLCPMPTNKISLTNLNKELPSVLIKGASKSTVRECDETSPNHFEAYVDEGDKSFDVSLDLDAEKTLIDHSCDCGKRSGICKHTIAVLLHLAADKEKKGKGSKSSALKPAKIGKKGAEISKAQQLLDSLDRSELAAWVSTLLQKTKDIELAFLHHFDTQTNLSPEQVQQLTNDAVKSVLQRKKKADASEVKKIVDLWKQVHAPVLSAYQTNPNNLDTFDNLHTLLQSCLECHSNMFATGNRITSYLEKTLESTVTSIAGLQQTEEWQTAISLYAARIENEHTYDYTKKCYIRHLEKILALADKERKSLAVGMLAETYRALQKKKYDIKELTRVLFALVVETNTIDQYLKDIRPMHWEPAFNVSLIRQYIDRGWLKEAERFCWEQIERNAREEYNTPYLAILREMYTQQDSTSKLAKVAEALIPLQWKLDDFNLAATNIKNDKERLLWRKKIFAKARTCSLHGDYAATIFTFALLDHEKNYERMIGIIDAAASWPLILQYFEKMYAENSELLFVELLRKEEFNPRIPRPAAPDESKTVPQLLKKIFSFYSTETVIAETTKLVRQDRSRFHNRLFRGLMEMLQ